MSEDIQELHGDSFYNFVKNGGAWSFDPKNPGRLFKDEKN